MDNQYVIGVDIGTQGTKAALFSAGGSCLATAFVKSRLHQPRSGIVEEDPERQVDSVCQTIRQCVRASKVPPREIAGIGVDGQMAGIIGVGRDGIAITPYDSWLDTRCTPYIETMKEAANEEIIEKTGGPPGFNHGPKILWWKKESPRVYRSIQAFVQPGGYAVMQLCHLDGAAAFIDRTYLHFSGFADNRRARWDEALCRQFDISPKKLPLIVEPCAVMGTLCAAMARRCGLQAGVPVVAGCGDTAASFLASGATREGVCVDVAGSASVFAATTKSFLPDHNHHVLSCGSAATPGLWHSYAYVNGGGMNVEWFRGIMATAMARSVAQLTLKDMDALAATVPLSADLPMFVPHLAGRVSPCWPRLRGAWVGLGLQHGLGHLYRAVLESVALEYGYYKKAIKELQPSLELGEVKHTGGGGRSELWNQIKADVLGAKFVPTNRGEGAPLGAALLAAHGVGLMPDLVRASDTWTQTFKGVSPVRRNAAFYAVRQTRYEQLLDSLNAWSSFPSNH
jgi:xylulokinase